MKEILQNLQETPYGFLATIDNGKPKVRPFGFLFEEDGKLYFCTNSKKDVYLQLLANPYVEYAATTKTMVTVRISGEAVFCEDIDKKGKAINSSEMIKHGYKSAENPIFKVFYVEHGTATIADFSGNPPKVFEF